LELARRGWDVTGIDLVPKAIAEASERAHAAGDQNVRFVEGDVTALRKADFGDDFRFLLDIECFNWLTDDQRRAMASEVNAIAASDASMLLLVWRRARRGPLPNGATRQDIEGVFDVGV
jgi:2-polyprenyl-3-methyl-5-hydroxy-6-metoxy-1,4-benzoquinol methylase